MENITYWSVDKKNVITWNN